MIHEFTIKNWHPVSENKLLTCHWAKAGRLKKIDKFFIAAAKYENEIPAATTKRRVEVLITLKKGQRSCDPTNYWKSLLDALVECGLLKNDSKAWCETKEPTFNRAAVMSTTITLTDL